VRLKTNTVKSVDDFYAECLEVARLANVPFVIGGYFSVFVHTGIQRATKDIDIFCKPGDFPRILNKFTSLGYNTHVEDERWLAKVKRGDDLVDIIYGSSNLVAPVTDLWIERSTPTRLFGIEVNVLGVTELIWSKVFIQNRERYDGADVAHLILKKHEEIDWKLLLSYMDQYWEVLLGHILNFRFIYPSERERIPRWLLDELLGRLQQQIELPTSRIKMCRGRLYSKNDYTVDVVNWGFADLVGGENEHGKPSN
jgi:hypothetical protein